MNKENNEIEKILDTAEENAEAEDTTAEAEDTTEDEIDEAALLDELSGKKPKKAKKEKKRRTAGTKRRRQYRAGFTATIVITVALVILLNVIVGIVADRFPIMLDISKDKAFTLSEQSIEIAEQVESEIELVIFADKDTFENPTTEIPEMDTALREFSNALKQYNSHSSGKVTYTFIDPSQEPQKFAAYSEYEVQAGDMLFLAGERYKVATVYDGNLSNDLYTLDTSSYSYDGTYFFESNVEKLLASNIYALSSGEDHIIQVLVGHEEDSYLVDGLKSLYELNGYTFEELTVTGSKDFNADADIMLIPAPEKDYSAEEVRRVQEWVYNKGNYGRQLMVFTSPTADCPNLYEFLEVEYQITVTDELIVETDYNRIQNYNYLYTMTDVPTNNYTTAAAGTSKVFTPYVRRLTTTLSSSLEDGSIGNYAVPLTEYPESAKLAKLESLTATESSRDEEITYAAPEGDYPLTGMLVHAIDSYNNDTQMAVEGRVLVSGCAAIAYSSYLQNSSLNNEELMLGAINEMTGVESTITISSKTISTDTVSFTNATALIVGIGVFTVGLPLIVLIICLVVFVRRKNL